MMYIKVDLQPMKPDAIQKYPGREGVLKSKKYSENSLVKQTK